MRIARALIVVTGLAVSTLALAAPPPWSNSRHNRGYHDGYDYAPVTRVEPIVRRVRIETPRRERVDAVTESRSPLAMRTISATRSTPVIHSVMGCST